MKSKTWYLACAIVLMISAMVYLPSLSGMPIWEDHTLIAGSSAGNGNLFTRCFSEPFLGAYFRPLVSASFSIERVLHGPTPLFYHTTNVLLHTLTVGAVIGLLAAAFNDRRIALIGGLLFAIQPAQVGAVAWIGGRTDSLCALWVSLFAWSLVAAARSEGRKRTVLLVPSAAAYLAAMLTKEQSLVLLPLVPLAFRCFPKVDGVREEWRNAAKWSVPFIAATLIFVVGCLLLAPETRLSQSHVLGTDMGIVGRTILYYFLLLGAPTREWIHTLTLVCFEGMEWPAALAGWGVVACAAVFFLRLIRKAPEAAWLLALAMLAILPVSNALQMPTLLVTPYRASIAGIGASGLLAWMIVKSLAYWRAKQCVHANCGTRFGQVGLLAATTAYGVWCLYLTVWGARQWQDEISLDTTFAKYDRSIFIYTNLCTTLNNFGDSRRAASLMEGELTWLFSGESWKNDGSALRAFRYDRRIVARIMPNMSSDLESARWVARLFATLGLIRQNAKDIDGARKAFHTALAFEGSNADANMGLGICDYRAGDLKSATSRLRLAAALDPTVSEAHSLLGKIYMLQRQWQNARAEFEYVVRQKSWLGSSYTDLADSQLKLGDVRGARASFQSALRSAVCDRSYVQSRLASLEVSQ